jgi:hypothetical protein
VDFEGDAGTVGHLADMGRVRGDDGVPAADGPLDDGHVDDVVVVGPGGEGTDLAGLVLREDFDVAALEEPESMAWGPLASLRPGHPSGPPEGARGRELPGARPTRAGRCVPLRLALRCHT